MTNKGADGPAAAPSFTSRKARMFTTLHRRIIDQSAELSRDKQRVRSTLRGMIVIARKKCGSPKALAGGFGAGFLYGLVRCPDQRSGAERRSALWRQLVRVVPTVMSLAMALHGSSPDTSGASDPEA